jgi:hypothetical protein
MQWWNDFVDWLSSDDGWRVISTAVIPFVAIVVAGFVAALIGRASSRRLIAMTDRERRTATVGALISAARRASKWNSLSVPEQQHAEHLTHEAETRIRLLALPGSAMVADWAAHEIEEMKRNSVSFSFQAEQSLIEFRNRLVEWQAKPGRAKKLFKADLDAWAYEGKADDDLVSQQKAWAKQQVNETGPISTIATSTPAPAAPAAAATAADSNQTAAFTAPSYELPKSVEGRESARPVEDWTAATPTAASTGTTPKDEIEASGEIALDPEATPGPVSAGTVRKRTEPEQREY